MVTVTDDTIGAVAMDRFLDAIERHYMTNGRADQTVRDIRLAVRRLVEDVGVRVASDLDSDAVRRFAERYPRLLGVLRTVCKCAVELGLLSSVPDFPATNFQAVPEAGDVPSPNGSSLPSREDVRRLLEHLQTRADTWRGYRLYALIATVVKTRLYRDEALELRVEDIDLVGGTIYVRRREATWSTAFPLRVPVSDTLKQVLGGWLQQAGCEYAFPGERRAGPWNKPLVGLKTAARAAGIGDINFEVLRLLPFDVELPPTAATVGAASPDSETRPLAPARQLTLDEATRLMARLREDSATWEGHRLYAATALGLLAGLRRGEVLKLRIEHVDLRGSRLRIPGRPPVVLTPEAASILGGWIRRPDRGGRMDVFPGALLRGPWIGGNKKSKFMNQFRAVAEAAGIPGRITFESLRHLWQDCAKRVELGEAWRAVDPPAPILKGPQPGRPGPAPKSENMRKGDRKTPARLPDMSQWDPNAKPTVVLGKPGEPVIVRGKEKRRLTRAQHRTIAVLLEAWPGGMSLKAMNETCGKGWRTTLVRLKESDPDWKSVIAFPGKIHPGKDSGLYRILPH
jgi:integrase